MIRDTIIRKIVELDVAGNSLHEDNVQATNDLLYQAAMSEFGSWETALLYAGVSARDVGGFATCRRIVSNNNFAACAQLDTI